MKGEIRDWLTIVYFQLVLPTLITNIAACSHFYKLLLLLLPYTSNKLPLLLLPLLLQPLLLLLLPL